MVSSREPQNAARPSVVRLPRPVDRRVPPRALSTEAVLTRRPFSDRACVTRNGITNERFSKIACRPHPPLHRYRSAVFGVGGLDVRRIAMGFVRFCSALSPQSTYTLKLNLSLFYHIRYRPRIKVQPGT